MDRPVVGRFAPSPSGRMHLGNVFCALMAWLSARSAGGTMVLRMEDLDPDRCKPAFAQALLDDLRWLGLDWDQGVCRGGLHGPYEQSRRGLLYTDALERLERRGLVYPCFCTRAELHAASAPHASDGTTVYSGRCRGLSRGEAADLARTRKPALRLIAPNREIGFWDGCQGEYRERLARDCGDFVLRRSDGVYAYQLAVVVDDGSMGVTQVVRGRDLLSSTPRQLYLYELLGLTPPAFYHVPLLVAPDGRRLSKRERDLDLGALRAGLGGPEPLLGWLAASCGLLDRPEPVTARELAEVFDWGRVKKENIVLGQAPVLRGQ